MASKKSIEEEISDFLDLWGRDQLVSFLRDVIPLFELYDVQDEGDWVEEAVGQEDMRNVRLIRTVYLVSKIADFHAGRLSTIKCQYKELWKKMQKHVEECRELSASE